VGTKSSNFPFEVIRTGKRLIYGGKAEVSDFIKSAQRIKDSQSNVVCLDLRTMLGTNGLLYLLRQDFECIIRNLTPLARSAYPLNEFVPAEFLRHTIALSNQENASFQRGKSSGALIALSTTPDCHPMIDGAGINDFG